MFWHLKTITWPWGWGLGYSLNLLWTLTTFVILTPHGTQGGAYAHPELQKRHPLGVPAAKEEVQLWTHACGR